MQELKSWIEAQLKRGYSRKQIKNALIRKGYSPKAVAEVDKVKVSSLQKNQLSKKPGNQFILVILIIGIVLLVWFLLPSSQKQGETAKFQTNEQAVNEEILSIEEKKLIEAKAGEEAKEALKDFNNDFCNTLMPENIRGMPLNEYSLNYHIDGSFGENVKWAASEQPKAEFSLFDSPKLFFVYSDGKFEGCGYSQDIINNEKIVAIKSLLKFSTCKDKQIYLGKINQILNSQFDIYLIKSETLIQHIMVFTQLGFSDENKILLSLGCI